MWGDEKFSSLSRPKPNGQSLWQYLLTGPHTTALPCAFMSGEASLAEALDWPIAGFRKAFQELFTKGMVQYDWKARLVFIPNALRHNPPENPNVVIGWKSAFDELPDCPLKKLVYSAIQAYLRTLVQVKGFSEAFLKPFHEDLPEELPKTDTVTVTGTVTRTGTEQREEAASPPLVTLGEFSRVQLTENQRDKLTTKLNGNFDSYVERFDHWVNEAPDAKDRQGVKRKDRHAYESIGAWYDRDVKEGKVKQSGYTQAEIDAAEKRHQEIYQGKLR
jgi:hypothetical protein